MKLLCSIILFFLLPLPIGAQAINLPFQVILLNVSNNGGQQVTVKYQSLVQRIEAQDFARAYGRAAWLPFNYFKDHRTILYRGKVMEEWPLDYFRSIEAKAQDYYKALVQKNPLDTVLIGFSQYGLVARRMAQIDTELWETGKIPRPRIRGLITLMTPHGGIPVFDPQTMAQTYYKALGILAKTLRDARFEEAATIVKTFTGQPLNATGSPALDRLGFYWLLNPLIRAFKDFGDLDTFESFHDQDNFIKGLESLKSSLLGFGVGSASLGPLGLDKIHHPALNRITENISELINDLKRFGKGTKEPKERQKLVLDLIAVIGSFVGYFLEDGGSSFLSLGWTSYPVLRVRDRVISIDLSRS